MPRCATRGHCIRTSGQRSRLHLLGPVLGVTPRKGKTEPVLIWEDFLEKESDICRKPRVRPGAFRELFRFMNELQVGSRATTPISPVGKPRPGRGGGGGHSLPSNPWRWFALRPPPGPIPCPSGT